MKINSQSIGAKPTYEPQKAYHHVPHLCSSLQATDSAIESS